MLECYFDESGSHSDRILIIGGFVADVNKWADFSRVWKEILSEYKLKYFHMKEFMNGRSRVFRHLSLREKRDLLGLLIAATKRTAIFSICCLAKPYEYEQLTTPDFRNAFGSCYAFSVRWCLIGIDRLLTDPTKGTETLGVFIEDGHPNCAEAIEHIRQHKVELDPIPRSLSDADIGLPRFDNYDRNDPYRERGLKIGAYGAGSKMMMPPLQVADILVYSAHAAGSGTKADAYTKSIWTNLAECVPPYVMPLKSSFISDLVQNSDRHAQNNREKRRLTAQVIRDANRFGLRAAIIPHKGVDFFGKTRDVDRFIQSRMKKQDPE